MKLINIGRLIEIELGRDNVAEYFDVSPCAISQWKSANSVPKSRAREFAERFNVSPYLVHDPFGEAEVMSIEETDAALRDGRFK